jgi:magnesium-transporting ATPase (P-type)
MAERTQSRLSGRSSIAWYVGTLVSGGILGLMWIGLMMADINALQKNEVFRVSRFFVTLIVTVLVLFGLGIIWYDVGFNMASGDIAFAVATVALVIIFGLYVWLLSVIMRIDRFVMILEERSYRLRESLITILMSLLYASSLPYIQYRLNRIKTKRFV